MNQQDNTKKEPSSKTSIARVVRIEIALDKTNVLKFVPPFIWWKFLL